MSIAGHIFQHLYRTIQSGAMIVLFLEKQSSFIIISLEKTNGRSHRPNRESIIAIMNVKCSHTTKAKQPCNAWAIRGSDPPACATHSGRAVGGAPLGNKNALKHGFYSLQLTKEETADLMALAAEVNIEEELAICRVMLRRLMEYQRANPKLEPREMATIFQLIFKGIKTVAALVKQRNGSKVSNFEEVLGSALDELSDKFAIDL